MILEIGKVIYTLLTEDPELTKLVHKQVYPLIADLDTKFPFIVYRRTSVEPITSKDRIISRSIGYIEIIIASPKYEESVKIATLVKNATVNKGGLIGDIQVKSISLMGADEDYMEDTYILKINLKVEI